MVAAQPDDIGADRLQRRPVGRVTAQDHVVQRGVDDTAFQERHFIADVCDVGRTQSRRDHLGRVVVTFRLHARCGNASHRGDTGHDHGRQLVGAAVRRLCDVWTQRRSDRFALRAKNGHHRRQRISGRAEGVAQDVDAVQMQYLQNRRQVFEGHDRQGAGRNLQHRGEGAAAGGLHRVGCLFTENGLQFGHVIGINDQRAAAPALPAKCQLRHRNVIRNGGERRHRRQEARVQHTSRILRSGRQADLHIGVARLIEQHDRLTNAAGFDLFQPEGHGEQLTEVAFRQRGVERERQPPVAAVCLLHDRLQLRFRTGRYLPGPTGKGRDRRGRRHADDPEQSSDEQPAGGPQVRYGLSEGRDLIGCKDTLHAHPKVVPSRLPPLLNLFTNGAKSVQHCRSNALTSVEN